MRSRKTALPKSYSWLPGVKMSGATMLVSVTMPAPWSRLDISDGDSVSPAWAKITWPPPALAVGHQRVRHQVDVVDQDEGHLCRVRCRLRAGKAHAAHRDEQQAGGDAAGYQHGRGRCRRCGFCTRGMGFDCWRFIARCAPEKGDPLLGHLFTWDQVCADKPVGLQ
jgi:hypothetical protein